MDEFRTCVHNILPFIEGKHIDHLSRDIVALFDKKNFELIVRAMLSVSDYGIDLGGSYFGNRVYFGNRFKDWYNILSTTDRNDYPMIIRDFFEQYYETQAGDIKGKLNEIIDRNLIKYDMNDWRYYFIKYPSLIKDYPGFIDSSNLIVLMEKKEGGKFCVPHRLNGKQLTGYHACALYLEVSQRITGDTTLINRGKDAGDLSSLVFKSGTEVKLTPEGDIRCLFEEEGDVTDQIATRAVGIFDEQDTSGMDYVEKLEIMCRDVIKAENEIL